MNESETRAEHIDPALKAAGWGVVEGSRVRREYEITLGRLEGGYGHRAKGLCADYVLTYRDHNLAVIEAKAWDESLTEGVAQAKNYADKMQIRFAYSTNGREIYGIDWLRARKASSIYIPLRRNSGTARSRKPMPGEIALPPYPSRIKAATFNPATTRTLPSTA